MPQFVILEHDHPVLHWDLMLEASQVLRTWRLASLPRAREAIVAETSFDHRLHYLDYEGPVEGNRGSVRRWDQGSYEVVRETAAEIHVRFEGEQLTGAAVLSYQGDDTWTFQYFVP